MKDHLVTRTGNLPFNDIHIASPKPFKGEDKRPIPGCDGLESKYVRCKFCGFICNVKRDDKCPFCESNNYK